MYKFYKINNKRYFLNLSYNRIIFVFDILKNEDFTETEKIEIAFSVISRGTIITPLEVKKDTIEAAFSFFGNGKKGNGDGEKLVDFGADREYIFSSILKEYKIDLKKDGDKIEFATFLSLFEGLSEESYIKQIMNIRGRKIPKPNGRNGEEIAQILRLKEYYKLEKTLREQEADNKKSINGLFDYLEGLAVKKEVKE